jgi:hypothetical protein
MTEASAAQSLPALLVDERLWRSPADLQEREDVTAEAVRLYEATSPVFASADSGEDDLFAQAVWVIRDIADRCAVLSKEWEAKELRRWVYVPDRETVEDSIRGTGLDRWAEGLGHPLLLGTEYQATTRRGHVAEFRRMWKLRSSRQRLADEFVAVEETYQQTLEIRRTEGLDWFKEHTRAMRSSAVFIAGARNNLVWAATMEDAGAVAVTQALLLVAQGMFVATHAASEDEANFPTREFLRASLHRSGGVRWLSTQRGSAPEWLTEG